MTNPTTTYELIEFENSFDIGKLMTNFFDVVSWATYQSVHTHHLQFVDYDIPTVGAGAEASVTGLTWPTPFPAGVVPFVVGFANSTGALGTGQTWLIFSAFNVSNTGCDMRLYNSRVAAGAGPITGGGRAIAFDPTFTVTGV